MRFILYLLALFYSLCSSACQLSVQLVEYPPLAYRDAQGNWDGLNKHYVDALLSKVGCGYHFVDTPFARGLQMVSAGTLDMAVDVSRIPEREAEFYFIGPQRQEVILLVSRRGAIPVMNNWDDMHQLDAQLIRQRGAYYGQRLQDVLQQNQKLRWQVDEMADNEAIVDLVLKGRADGFFVESSYWHYLLANHEGADNLEAHPLIINSESVFYAFSKASVSEHLIFKLEAAFKELETEKQFIHLEESFFQAMKRNGLQ